MKRLLSISVALLVNACGSAPKMVSLVRGNSAAEIARLELDLLKARAKRYYVSAPREMELSEQYVRKARIERARKQDERRVYASLVSAEAYLQSALAKNGR